MIGKLSTRAGRDRTLVGVRGLTDDLMILLVAIIWGSSYVVMQAVGEETPSAAFLMLRFLCALPPIALLALRTLPRLTRNEAVTGVFFGTLLYGILILETIGVRFTSAANAGFLITVSVVLIPPLERVISRRRHLPVVYAMTVVALVGCGLLLLSGGVRFQAGDAIILAAAMIRATQITLFGRRSPDRPRSPANLTFVQFVVVAVLAALTAIASGDDLTGVVQSVSLPNWLLIAYLGVLGTSFAFFAQLRAARAASSTRVGLILSTEPVFAAGFAVLVAGDVLTPLQVVGAAMIVVSAAVGRTYDAAVPRPDASRPERRSSTRPCADGRDDGEHRTALSTGQP